MTTCRLAFNNMSITVPLVNSPQNASDISTVVNRSFHILSTFFERENPFKTRTTPFYELYQRP